MDRRGKSVPDRDKRVPDTGDASFGGVLPCKAFLEYDWKGRFGGGEARCSILLEAVKNGEAQTHESYKKISNTTRNRAMLKMAINALSELKPCRLEIHSASRYLADGIQGRFARQKAEGYRGIKNADLIDEFLEAAEPFRITVVTEDRNEYTEAMRIQRELRNHTMRIERDNGYGK